MTKSSSRKRSLEKAEKLNVFQLFYCNGLKTFWGRATFCCFYYTPHQTDIGKKKKIT